MHRNQILFTLSAFTIVVALACGNENEKEKLANQGSVNSLSTLIKSHPEFSEASLKEIKDAALGTKANETLTSSADKAAHINSSKNVLAHSLQNSSNSPKLKHIKATAHDKTPSHLDPKVADDVQKLIDEILENFDFMAQINASFKIMGIQINMQNKMMESFKKETKNFGGKDDFAHKSNTCEEFINNPFKEIPKEQMDSLAKTNRDMIKKTLSGCSEIKGGDFLQCVMTFNRFVAAINEHATCSMEDMETLLKTIKQNAGIDFVELQRTLATCMTEHFGACGLKEKNVATMKAEAEKDKDGLPKKDDVKL